MSEKEKDFEEKVEAEVEETVEEKEETFEDIFSSLREKYNLDPFEGDEKTEPADEKVFYNPEEDSEIDDFFKEKEEGYTALYEEVDAKIASVDDNVLQKEAEVFNIEFKKAINQPEAVLPPQEFEDVYSQSADVTEEDDVQVEAEEVQEEIAEEITADETPEEKSEPEAVNEANEDEVLPPAPVADEIPVVADEPVMAETPVQENIEPENGDEPEKKKGGAGEVIRKIIFTISIIALIGSAAWLINDYFIQPYLINKENAEIENIIADAIQAEDASPEEVIEKLNNLDDKQKTVTFDSLKKINSDFKAWIVVPGADINLAVVQGKNNDKYLNTGFKGKWSSGGTAFIDYQNKEPFFDMNTIIYGHNMRDGSMFGKIKNYKSTDAFKENPYVYVYTENENYVYKIYSVFLTNAQRKDDDGYVLGYTFKNLSTQEKFSSYMEEIKLRSYFDSGVDYQEGDKILTLSTCDRTVLKDARLVLVARLVRENEDESVDTSLAKKNKNQKFPAGYYSKKKMNNPYKDAVKWEAE